jgi:hypothetical protein
MAAKAKTDTKPKQTFNAIGQDALKAQGLAQQHAVEIGTRLSPAFLASFAADIKALSDAVPTVINKKSGTVQLTTAQATALDSGYKLVKGFRTTVKGLASDKAVLEAYGVGDKTNKLLVKDVIAAINMILARVAAQPTEAAGFDIVDLDVAALKAALATITAADTDQEAARAKGPVSTADRNATAWRLIAGVKKIAGAGMRSCAADPTVYAQFEALANGKGA